MEPFESDITRLDPVSITLLITLLVLLFISIIFIYQMYLMIQRAKFMMKHSRIVCRQPVMHVSREIPRKRMFFQDEVNTHPPRVPLNESSRVPLNETIKVQIEQPPRIEIEEAPSIQIEEPIKVQTEQTTRVEIEEPISSRITEHERELSSNEQKPPSGDRKRVYCV